MKVKVQVIPDPDTQTDPAIIQGKNGVVQINEVSIGSYGVIGQGEVVAIEGSNKRGVTIIGGFYAIPIGTMDKLAEEWLKARGKKSLDKTKGSDRVVL